MQHEVREYPSGLKLILNKTDSALCCVLVRIEAGVEHEKKREEGMTSLVEKLLAFGTVSYPSRKSLKSQIDSFGGILSTAAFLDCIELAIEVVSDKVKSAIEVLSEMVFQSQMRAVDVSLAKDLQIAQLSDQPKDSQLYCHDALRSVLFSGSGLSKNIFGRKSTLEKLTSAEVKEYWNSVLSPKNVVVSITGNVDAEQVYENVFSQFYSKFLLQSGKETKATDEFLSSANSTEERAVYVSKRLNQTRLNLGFRIDGTASSPSYAFSRHSVLFLAQLVNKKITERFKNQPGAYIYDCQVRLFANAGMLGVSVACDSDKTIACANVCVDAFIDLIQNGWDDIEYKRQREIYKTKFAKYISTQKNMSRLSSRVLAQTGHSFNEDQEIGQIDTITQASSLKLLKNILAGKPYLAVVGEKLDVVKLLGGLERKFAAIR